MNVKEEYLDHPATCLHDTLGEACVHGVPSNIMLVFGVAAVAWSRSHVALVPRVGSQGVSVFE